MHQLDLHHAARPAGDRGPPARVLGPVRHDDDVGGEQVAVRLGERAEERAADLLLAVEDELHVDRRREPERVHQLDRVQVTPDRPLVVGGAARVEQEAAQLVVADTGERDLGRLALGEPAAEDGLDRIRLKPPLEREWAWCRSGNRSARCAWPPARGARRIRPGCRRSRARARRGRGPASRRPATRRWREPSPAPGSPS